MKLAATLVLAACSAAPRAPAPASLPTRVPLARPAPDAALAPVDPSPGCLSAPDTVSFLDADAHVVRACFALRDGHPDECVTIDRHTSRIAHDPDPPQRPLPVMHHIAGVGRISANNFHTSICRLQRCIFDAVAAVPLGSDVDIADDERAAIVTLPPAGATDEPRFEIMAAHGAPAQHAFSMHNGDHCGTGLMLGDIALVETSDCTATGHAFLYNAQGNMVRTLGDRPDWNAFGAWPVDLGNDLWAVVVPAEYTVIIFDSPAMKRRDVVDLVPIQAESTPTPSFVETHAKDGTWLIASPTGGVGIIDPVRDVLANAWIIPRCEASP